MAWKINFLHVFKFRPLFCNQWAWKPVKTTQHMKMPSCGHIQHHIWWFGTDFRLEIASSNHWNGLKNHFFAFFKFLPLFGFQMTKYGAEYIHRKVFSCAELFSQVSRSTGCQKVEEIWQNAKMLIFRPFAQCSRSLQSARIWSKSSILCSLGPWWGFGICKVVSQCLLVFSR